METQPAVDFLSFSPTRFYQKAREDTLDPQMVFLVDQQGYRAISRGYDPAIDAFVRPGPTRVSPLDQTVNVLF
jgi:hypothetical protein